MKQQAQLCKMAGGPPVRQEIDDRERIIMEVTGAGVQTGAILTGNNFQGQFTSRNSYTGPPPGEGAGPVRPGDQTGGTINIRNDGSHSHQPIARNNTFGGDVVFEQNINIQPSNQNNNEERHDEWMDMR